MKLNQWLSVCSCEFNLRRWPRPQRKSRAAALLKPLSSEHHAYLYSLPVRLATLFGCAGRPPETWTKWIFLIDLLTVVICSDSCWRAFQVRRAEFLYLQRACGLTAPRSRMIPKSWEPFFG